MAKLVNRVRVGVASAPGTGAISLGPAIAGYQAFAASGVSDGDVVSYAMEDGTAWEVGLGTYASSGTTLARTTILGSSNGGAAISATSGAQVFITPLATDLVPSSIQGGFKALKITNGATPNTQVTITADAVCLQGPLGYLTASNVNATASSGSTGANGLDTGTIANSTWCAVWVISNGSTTAALLSTSATSPTMPSGYTYKARVGWVRTDSSGNLLRTLQLGRRAQYVIAASSNTTAFPTLATGANSWPTAVSTGSAVPPTASALRGGALQNNGAATIAPNANYLPLGNASNPAPFGINNSNFGNPYYEILLESTTVYVQTTAGAVITATGWEDNL